MRKEFGDDIILYDEQDESVVYRILKEFILEGQGYAVLQSEQLKKDDEVALFRMHQIDGEIGLETIEDDDEWETVSEIYDEMTFPEK